MRGRVILHLLQTPQKELPKDVFDGLPKLYRLGLRNNKLTELPSGVFDDLPSLQHLTLVGNPGAPFDVNLPGVQVVQ